MGQAVILQNDALRFVFKEPVDRRAHRDSAAQIVITKQCFELTRPVYCSGNSPDLLAALFLPRSILAGSVCSNIEPWWARLTNGFKSLGCRIRSVENEEENRSMHLQASLHLPQSVSRDHVLCVPYARTGRGHVIRSVANAGRPEDAYSCSLPRFQPTVYDSPGI